MRRSTAARVHSLGVEKGRSIPGRQTNGSRTTRPAINRPLQFTDYRPSRGGRPRADPPTATPRRGPGASSPPTGTRRPDRAAGADAADHTRTRLAPRLTYRAAAPAFQVAGDAPDSSLNSSRTISCSPVSVRLIYRAVARTARRGINPLALSGGMTSGLTPPAASRRVGECGGATSSDSSGWKWRPV